jgi:hypothetical protein
MKFTISTASAATGKGKSTIHRAIQSGKLSATRLDDGSFEIDASELFRIYSPIPMGHPEIVPVGSSGTQILQVENEFLKRQLEREREFVRSLEVLLTEANTERRELLQLLTHEPQKTKTGLLWKRIFKEK